MDADGFAEQLSGPPPGGFSEPLPPSGATRRLDPPPTEDPGTPAAETSDKLSACPAAALLDKLKTCPTAEVVPGVKSKARPKSTAELVDSRPAEALVRDRVEPKGARPPAAAES